MNAKILLTLQLTSFVIMLGSAESLFSGTIGTLVFFTALAVFAKCSIYINRNDRWLLRNIEDKEQRYADAR